MNEQKHSICKAKLLHIQSILIYLQWLNLLASLLFKCSHSLNSFPFTRSIKSFMSSCRQYSSKLSPCCVIYWNPLECSGRSKVFGTMFFFSHLFLWLMTWVEAPALKPFDDLSNRKMADDGPGLQIKRRLNLGTWPFTLSAAGVGLLRMWRENKQLTTFQIVSHAGRDYSHICTNEGFVCYHFRLMWTNAWSL